MGENAGTSDIGKLRRGLTANSLSEGGTLRHWGIQQSINADNNPCFKRDMEVRNSRQTAAPIPA